jgi:hypothetical protein
MVDKMSDENARYIQVGDWVFEVKTVRALRVDEYGKPYSAIANCNLNGNSMYIDGLLTKDDQEFSKEDFLTFHKFSQKMGLDNFSYHRYHNGESVTKDVKVQALESKEEPKERRMRLVK